MPEKANGISFAGKELLDPAVLKAECDRLRLPSDAFWGRANGFRSPLGREPGSGVVIMTKKEMDAIDFDSEHSLTFDPAVTGVEESQAEWLNLTVADAICVTPSHEDDENQAFALRIVDRRHKFSKNVPIEKHYNVRNRENSEEFYSWSENGGSPWTWDEMLEDIWNDIPLNILSDDWPGLPSEPAEGPENWSFQGVEAWDAIHDILERLGFRMALDPITNNFVVHTYGADDDALEAGVDFSEVMENSFAPKTNFQIANRVKVIFRRHQDGADEEFKIRYPVYVEEAGDDAMHTTYGLVSANLDDDTFAIIHDDMVARVDADNALVNAAEIAARATERAQEYYRRATVNNADYRFGRRVLSGINVAIAPGAQADSILWGDFGYGPTTTIILPRHLKNRWKFNLSDVGVGAIREGFLDGALLASTDDGETETTANASRWSGSGDDWADSGITDVITNRDDTLGLASGTYILYANVNGENRIVFHGCLVQSEIQTITILGSPTGGTFTISHDGNTTAPIAWNASAATVQAELELLASIGAGNVLASGGPFPGSVVTCTFRNDKANTDMGEMTVDGGSLTGGVGVSVYVTTTQQGRPN